MRPADDTIAHSLLSDLPDSHVLVLPGPLDVDGDLLTAAWQAARDDAYDAYDADKIKGRSSADILSILGFSGRAALVHRDDLVVG